MHSKAAQLALASRSFEAIHHARAEYENLAVSYELLQCTVVASEKMSIITRTKRQLTMEKNKISDYRRHVHLALE